MFHTFSKLVDWEHIFTESLGHYRQVLKQTETRPVKTQMGGLGKTQCRWTALSHNSVDFYWLWQKNRVWWATRNSCLDFYFISEMRNSSGIREKIATAFILSSQKSFKKVSASLLLSIVPQTSPRDAQDDGDLYVRSVRGWRRCKALD